MSGLKPKVAVVGGRGFIGGAIVDQLRRQGYEVWVVSSNPNTQSESGYRYGDVLLPGTLDAALSGADVVVQSVNFRTYPIEKPKKGWTFRTFDAIGTQTLVKAARSLGIQRYVLVAGVGASLTSPRRYLQAIAEGELSMLASGMEAVSLRPAFVYGPRDRGLNRIIEFSRFSPFIPIVGDGKQLHQPVFIEDVANAACRLCMLGAPQGVFEIGGPDRMRMTEMLHRTLRVARLHRLVVPMPFSLATLGSRVLERLPGSLLTAAAVQFAADSFVANNDNLLCAFPQRLTQFEEGLSRYLPPNSLEKG